MITIKEIAQLMNVSPTTVANVIHGRTSKVSRENVARIQNALKEYNYVPRMGLEALTKGKTRLIIVAAHTSKHYSDTPVDDPFYGRTIGILENAIRKAGYYMMLYIDDNVDNIFKTAMSWNVAGIITITLSFTNYQKLCTLVSCPVVGVDTYTEDLTPMPDQGYHVTLDDMKAGEQMARYLIQTGFRHIMVVSESKIGSSGERAAGVKKVLTEYGLIKDKPWILQTDAKKKSLSSRFSSLLPLAHKGYVLFCTSDQLAFEVIDFLNEHGFSVPGDFSVCGFDNNPYARFSVPKLTTMHQDIDRKGELASEILFKLIDEYPVEEKTIRLPVELVVRKSVLLPSEETDHASYNL